MTLPALPAQGVPVLGQSPPPCPSRRSCCPAPRMTLCSPPGPATTIPWPCPPRPREPPGTGRPFAPSAAKSGFVRHVLISIQMGRLFISDAAGSLPRASASPHHPPRGGDAPSRDPAQDCGFTLALTPQNSAQAAASILLCLLLSLSLHSQR